MHIPGKGYQFLAPVPGHPSMPNAKCNDPFLNEHTDSLNPNGRVRRAEFKGWL